jgi:group I intron endonuclease
MVISQKMIEKEMGNRGSKSVVYLVLVSLLIYAFSPYISFILSLVLHFNELLFSNSILLAIFPFNSRNFSSTSAWRSQASGLFKGLHTLPESVVPVRVYANVDTQKLEILKENKGKSGIYCFTNLTNGKKYVGSSVNLGIRFSQYFNVNNLTRQNYMAICMSLLKYGYSGFSLEILEYCDSSELLTREKHFMDLLKPEYNIALGPAAPMSGRKHLDETRKKMSDAHKGLHVGENNIMFGKNHSDETRKKISGATSGENNPSVSGSNRRKTSVVR